MLKTGTTQWWENSYIMFLTLKKRIEIILNSIQVKVRNKLTFLYHKISPCLVLPCDILFSYILPCDVLLCDNTMYGVKESSKYNFYNFCFMYIN